MRIKKKKLSLIYRLKRDIYFSLIRFIRFFQSIFLKKQNNKFLFILSPPYCGSTLLSQLLSTSKNVSCNNNLGTREGQLLPGVRHFMFQKNRWNERVKYPWDKVKKVWLKYWDLSKPVLLDKSIPNIMRVSEIKKEFENINFICMVRNPYAQVEGVMRRNDESAKNAAIFSLKCLQYQRQNIKNKESSLFISYEQLTENPEKTKRKIIAFLPELSDIKMDLKYKAHNFKTKSKMGIVNLNQEKMEKLTGKQIETINRIFEKEKELLDYFDYQIVKR
tara:strand:- start:30 stop:857 length:828 start_codon:yes stop_codon:yes gene_type:complete